MIEEDIFTNRSSRSSKVSSVLYRAIAQFFMECGQYSQVAVTVLRVKVSPNMRDAVVFVSCSSPDQAKCLLELNENAGLIKSFLYRRVHLRHVPRIIFRLDEDFDRVMKVNELLRKEDGGL